MRRTQKRVSIPALVSAIVQNGGGFHFSEAGSLFADNLTSLPTDLRYEFFDCDGTELVRFLKTEFSKQNTGGKNDRKITG